MAKRIFQAWVLFLPPSSPKLWLWENWQEIYKIVDPLVQKVGEPRVMNILQFKSNRAVNSKPLLWNERNMQNWTHGSPVTPQYPEEVSFWSMSLWCPSQKDCLIGRRVPDLFFSVNRIIPAEKTDDPVSETLIHLAIAEKFVVDHELVSEVVELLKEFTRPLFLAELRTPWTIRSDEVSIDKFGGDSPYLLFKNSWNPATMPSSDIFELTNSKFEIVKSELCTY